MTRNIKHALALTTLAVAGLASAQVTLYERENFQGRTLTTEQRIADIDNDGVNQRASSLVVQSNRWEVCEDARFGGRCMVLRPGAYASLNAMGLNGRLTSLREVPSNVRVFDNQYANAPRPSEIVFYERGNFEGRSLTVVDPLEDFRRSGFNDNASSAMVIGQPWQLCDDFGFNGRCVVLRPGRYASLAAMGMDNRISSVRATRMEALAPDNRNVQPPATVYDNRRRNVERLYEVNITSVKAVMGPAEQRCWVEQQPVAAAPAANNPNMGGAVVGALIGGILGHQVGGGVGKDLATVGGAIAGGVIGSNVGRDANGQPVQTAQTQAVQRCDTSPSQGAPAYWDVTYTFRGQAHSVQMINQPGPTMTVNEQGEPRS